MLSCGVAAKSSFTNVLVAHVQVDEPDAVWPNPKFCNVLGTKNGSFDCFAVEVLVT